MVECPAMTNDRRLIKIKSKKTKGGGVKKRALMIFLIFFLSIVSVFGVQRKILVWNNDRGETGQENPDVARWNNGYTVIVWQDYRRGDWDIFAQIFDPDGKKQGDNFLINSEQTGGNQQEPAVACMKGSDLFVVVWESDKSGDWDIHCQVYDINGNPKSDLFIVNKYTPENQQFPRVAVSSTNRFSVCWQDSRDFAGNNWDVYGRGFASNGEPLCDDYLVNYKTAEAQESPDLDIYVPAKATDAVCYTWQDYRYGNWDIFMRRFYIDGGEFDSKDTLVIDQEAKNSKQLYPSIATDELGNMTIAWQDYRRGLYTVYLQRIKWDGTFIGSVNIPATKGGATDAQYIPCITSTRSAKATSVATIAWYDYKRGNPDIFGQCVDFQEGLVGNNFAINDTFGNTSAQIRPAIDRDNGSFQHYSTVWMDDTNPEGNWDIYFRISNDQGGPVTDELSVDRLLGVEALYDDDEDYDDPGTPSWNEDPRTDPVYYYESAKATIDMLKENNIDNLWQITEVETLPGRKGKAGLDDYDVVVVDLGWRHLGTGAGTMTTKERNDLHDYIALGNPVLITGNDFGYLYSGDPLYNKFYISYVADGNPFATGNIKKLYGKDDRFTRGMEFSYLFQDTCDNYVDRIDASGADTIFFADGPAKLYYMCGSAYCFAWKGERGDGNNSHLTFSLSGLISDEHPNTNIELIRRMMAFLGERVAPEPVTDLSASPTGTEGIVTLDWTAPMNQFVVPPDSAYGYIVKFTHYENVPPDYGKMTTDAEFDAGITYYQAWEPKKGTNPEIKTVRGLPPADTLIFAIKAYDNKNDTIRNSTLGDEPKVVVPGDTVTPHSIVIGSSGGYVKDFIDSEMMDIRNSDTLFFTWDASKLYIGYSRHNWQSPGGDMFVYFDIEGGGADSTYPENAGARNKLPEDFQADYCFRVGNYVSYQLYEDNGASDWNTTPLTYTGDFSEDDIVNSREYTEFSIPFSDMGYNPGNPFGFLVTCQNETNNNLWNSFPIENGIGKTTNLNYYYYFDALGSGVSPREEGSVLDIELSAFNAISRMDGIEIMWRTESENEIYQWIIEKKEDDDYNEIGRVNGAGNSQSPQEYTFLDRDVVYGHTYTYKLFSLNNSGNKTYCASIIVQFSPSLSRTPQLYPVSPNPARLNSKIRFSIPEKAFVSLKVYDISGRQIETVVYEIKEPGIYNINWPVKKHPQGVYFIEFQCENERVIRKITFLR